MRRANGLTIALAFVLLTCGLAGLAVAQETEMEEEISLTGRLSENSTGQYVLIDPESGDEVALQGSEDELAEYVGSTVTVSGRWAENDDGDEYFAVSSVEPADE